MTEEDIGASYTVPSYPKENNFATRDLLLSFLEDNLEGELFKVDLVWSSVKF
jgi:hypothetical protein